MVEDVGGVEVVVVEEDVVDEVLDVEVVVAANEKGVIMRSKIMNIVAYARKIFLPDFSLELCSIE